ncbi:uncharacterized protein LOC121258639 [Juglans microcarpa x Juglans regia]|uniref:uncharacterized protein LOC121258639 n=1 Tax=Juglans microcarpa x Juglans regia TaxID=2249226 RepID=UPI001B7EE971|nr:uncharacterized protein LOC121258639 [Juglans microcarpa x Juglans regia]
MPANDVRVVVNFLRKNIFYRFGTPRTIISDGGKHFCNYQFEARLTKYGVTHHVATPNDPQTSGQVDVSNWELKRILEKTMSTFQTDGTSPYWLVYGKAYHLLVDLEHIAYWVTRTLNFDLQAAGKKRILQINETDEFRNDAYENARIYKDTTKRWHDKHILRREFKIGKKVLLFNSRLQLFLG